jgi:Protein of unknown function (DUF3047)
VTRLKARVATSVLLTALIAAGAPAAGDITVPIADWEQHRAGVEGIPEGWATRDRVEAWRHSPKIDVDDGRHVLRLKTDANSIRLGKRVSLDVQATPVLAWQWKALVLPAHGDVRTLVDDQVGRVVVIFSSYFGSYEAIAYIWDTHAPVATEMSQVRGLLRRRMIVVRSGSTHANVWQSETRNVRDDYVRSFGAKPPKVVLIALESHSEDDAHRSEILFGGVAFRSAPAR